MKFALILLSIIILAFIVVQAFAFKSQYNIETYPYIVQEKYPDFEIRHYEATLFTSVKLETKGYKTSSRKGFSILAGYIFGKNNRNEKIAMTSPVSMSLEDSTTMMFMVPKSFSKNTLPIPNQSEIKLKEEPEKQVAVISFSGWANDKKINRYKQRLISILKKQNISHSSKFYFFGYNAPYEVFNRKNEIAVELN